MERHLSDDELNGYRKRTAAPKELIAASDHLASCDACYARFNTADRTAATYAFVRNYLELTPETGPDHLLYEQMAGYADSSLGASEEKSVKSHIQECPECDSDVRDLMKIRQRLEQKPAADAARTAAAATAKVASTTSRVRAARDQRSGRWAGASPYRLPRAYGLALQAACLLVVTGIAVWGVTRGLRAQIARLEQEAAALQQSNDELRRQASDAEKLQNQIAELESDNEHLRQEAGGGAASGVSLKDGGGVIALGTGGEVIGLEGLPSKYQDLLKGAISTGKV